MTKTYTTVLICIAASLLQCKQQKPIIQAAIPAFRLDQPQTISAFFARKSAALTLGLPHLQLTLSSEGKVSGGLPAQCGPAIKGTWLLKDTGIFIVAEEQYFPDPDLCLRSKPGQAMNPLRRPANFVLTQLTCPKPDKLAECRAAIQGVSNVTVLGIN